MTCVTSYKKKKTIHFETNDEHQEAIKIHCFTM
jgi:hypothetical protein